MNFCLVISICSKNSVCGSFATFFSCYVSVEYVMFLKTFPWKHTYDFLDSADTCRTRNFLCKRLALVSLHKLTSKLLVKYAVALARFLKRQWNILWYRWFLVFRCVYALMWKSYCCFFSIEMLRLNHCYVQKFFCLTCMTCIECGRRWVAVAMHFWCFCFLWGRMRLFEKAMDYKTYRIGRFRSNTICSDNTRHKSWNTCVIFSFPNVDLGITVVSVLQHTGGSTLGKERGTFEWEWRCQEWMWENWRKFKTNGFCFNDLWRVL